MTTSAHHYLEENFNLKIEELQKNFQNLLKVVYLYLNLLFQSKRFHQKLLFLLYEEQDYHQKQ